MLAKRLQKADNPTQRLQKISTPTVWQVKKNHWFPVVSLSSLSATGIFDEIICIKGI